MNKNDPVLCPWCNQPMKAVVIPKYRTLYYGIKFEGECWCTSCQAVSPTAKGEDGNGYDTPDEAKEAAVKIALKRTRWGRRAKDENNA